MPVPQPPWNLLLRWAREAVDETLADLPAPLREPSSALPVTYEKRPGPDLVEDGIEPDSLGLFVGPAYGEELTATTGVPAQILLFLENLWEYAEGDEEIFLDEVHTTYLHELGHYLGLDEDDLFDRGLE